MSWADRFWIVIAVVLGSATTTAVMLFVTGIGNGRYPGRIPAPAVAESSESGPVDAASSDGKISDRVNGNLAVLHSGKPRNASLFFEPPRLAAASRSASGDDDEASGVGGPMIPLTGTSESFAAKAVGGDEEETPVMERYAAFKTGVIGDHAAITAARLSEKNGTLLVDVRAEGGLFEPQIDNDMQLNARRVLRAAVLRKVVPKPIRSVVIRYALKGKKSALNIAWNADDLMGIDWSTATFPQMMDIGRVTTLSRTARDMVRNYCRVEGSPGARLCKTAFRQKAMK